MRFSALAQLVIAGPGPIRLNDRTASKLMEGLPEEFRTSQAPVNPNAFTAFLGNGSDSGELLDIGREFEPVAVGTECGQQTWSQGRTSSWKATKQGRVIMLVEQSGDLLVVTFDGFGQQRDLLDQGVDLHRARQQHGAVLGALINWAQPDSSDLMDLALLDTHTQQLTTVLTGSEGFATPATSPSGRVAYVAGPTDYDLVEIP